MSTTYNKVTFNGTTLIDLSQDTVTSAAHIVSGRTGHLADGTQVAGTATGGISGTYMFPIEQNNDGIWVPVTTDFSEIAEAQSNRLAPIGYDVASGTFVWVSYYENYEGFSEALSYGYKVPYTDQSDYRSYGTADIWVTHGYYNGALKTDHTLYVNYDTQNATATANKILSGYTAFGPNGIIDGTATLQPSLQSKSVNYTPSETAQNATVTPDSGYDGLSSVSVSIGAVSSTYVGTGVTRQAAKTVTPSESSQTAVASGVYTTGAVTVGAISSTYVGSGVDRNDSSDLTASGATVTAPAGYYEEAATKSVASGSATTPATTVTANPSISVSSSGLITATASATKSVTPTVSAGYVSSGTAGTITVSGSNTQQLTTLAATTYNTSTTDQTIASGRYLTGVQTIKAVTTANITAANVKAGTTVTVGDANDADRILSVTGTYTSDATASASDIISGETAYVNGTKVTGTLTVRTIYTGSTDPSSSTGVNGDVFVKVVS